MKTPPTIKLIAGSVSIAGLVSLTMLGCAFDEGTRPVVVRRLDTLFVVGTPAIDSNTLYLSLVGEDSSGNAITMAPSQITFRVDSATSLAGTPGQYAIWTADSPTVVPKSGRPLATQLIFDGSGSMSSSDPGAQRMVAGRDFVGVVADSRASEVAVAEFGVGAGDTYYYHLWTDYRSVHDTTPIFAALDSLSADAGTPLLTAIRRGLEDADSTVRPQQFSRSVVVLTDGQETDGYPQDSLGAVVSLANEQQIPVSTVGLGSGVNEAELSRLAFSTAGIYARVDSADALAAVYTALATAILSGYTQVAAQLSQAPSIYETLYVTVTVTSGGSTVSTQFVVWLPTVLSKRLSSKVG